MTSRLHLTIGLVALMTASASSQVVKPAGPLGPSTSFGGAAKKGTALINGSAVDITSAPLPNATVRLRNLTANQVEQVATTNLLGQFAFIAQPEMPYVIEIADHVGHILAVGDIITAQAGDVAGAVIAIPSRVPAIAGMFGETASSVVSATTSAGISVLDPLPPLSPEK